MCFTFHKLGAIYKHWYNLVSETGQVRTISPRIRMSNFSWTPSCQMFCPVTFYSDSDTTHSGSQIQIRRL